MRTGVLISLCLLNGSFASAKMYKWVDENGVTHYSQNKPESETVSEVKVKGINTKSDQKETSDNQSSSDLNCEQVVKYGIKLLKVDTRKKGFGDDSPAMAFLDDPNKLAEGIARCKKDSKDPKKAATWLCQQNAKSFKAIQACGKQ